MNDPIAYRENDRLLAFSGTADECFRAACEYFLGHERGPTPYTRETSDDTSPDQGKSMMEMSMMFHLSDPRNRLVWSKDLDIYNLVGLWIYLMSGSEDVNPINFYNPIARRFVDEGTNPTKLRGTWGARLFGTGGVDGCIRLLKLSPGTRRAIIPVLHPEDVGYPSRNLPCLASIQFAVQAEKLNCFVTMRSQALVGVWPYDVFLLTMLHEYVALRAGIPLGEFTQFAPLCGVRENEIPIMREAMGYPLEGQRWNKTSVAYRRDPMPDMQPLEGGQLALFHFCERTIRKSGTIPEEAYLLPDYWRGFLYVTYAKKNDVPDRLAYIESTFPGGFLLKSRETIRKRTHA